MPQAQVAQIDEVGVSQNDPLDAPPNAGSVARWQLNAVRGGPLSAKAIGESLPRRQRAGEAQLVAVWVVDVEVALAPRGVRR